MRPVPAMASYSWCVVCLACIAFAGCQTSGSITSPGIAQVGGHDTTVAEPRERVPQVRVPQAPAPLVKPIASTQPKETSIRLISGKTELTGRQELAGKTKPVGEETIQLDSTISLTDAVGRSLEQNPDLIALRHSDGVGSATLGVAQTYPFNPYVQVQATPYQDAKNQGPGTTAHYVLLIQNIQLANQQQFREEGASAALNTIRWNIHQAELLNVAQTQRLFLTALYLRGVMELAQASAVNNDELLRTLEKQLAAGNATAADVAIVRIDSRSTRQQARLAEATYQTALRDFRRQLNLSPVDHVKPAGDLRAMQWKPISTLDLVQNAAELSIEPDAATLEALASELAASRPDVLSARSDVDAARANLSLATASKTQDLQLGPYYQRTMDGTTSVGFRAQMDIPVFNSGAPLERQRHAELSQRVATWQQLHTRAALDAQAALERYRVALDLVSEQALEQSDSLPGEFQKLEKQFRAGEVDIIRVIQARTSLIQNRRAYLDSLNELAQSAANLTAAGGIAANLLDSTN